jgi:hypothetical protein
MALAQNNVPVPPAAIIEASYLPLSEKKKLQQMVAQVDPVQQATQQLGVQQLQANVGKTQAEAQKLSADAGKAQTGAVLNVAKARTEGMPNAPAAPPTPLDQAQQIANINETNATAMHKRASATGLYHKALLTPLQTMADHAQQNANRTVAIVQGNADGFHRTQDRALDDFHRSADREVKKKEIQQRLDQAVERNATPV